jgi:hypothetical protein
MIKFTDLHETVDVENKSQRYGEDEEEHLMEIRILLDRNLTIFDYKVLYAIRTFVHLTFTDKQTPIKIDIKIPEMKFSPPIEFNPNGLWFSEVRSIIRALDYYVDPENISKVNFRLMII